MRAITLVVFVGACAAAMFPELGMPLHQVGRTVINAAQRLDPNHQSMPTATTGELAPAQNIETAAATELSIPLENVSLRDRPELFEQLVATYQGQLARNSHDTTAQQALERLRQKGLEECEAIVAEADAQLAGTTFAIVSRLFPELADSLRYQVLAMRADRLQRGIERLNAQSVPPTTREASATPVKAATVIPTETPASPEMALQKPAAATVGVHAPKPEIRILSATPGAIQAGRFVPAQGGNVFSIVINYRNFANAGKNESPADLLLLLGNMSSREVLAEASTGINGERGTTNVLVETFVNGYVGETYKLNFVRNGEFLASRSIRLSAP